MSIKQESEDHTKPPATVRAGAKGPRSKPDRYLSPNSTAATLTRLELALMRSAASFTRWVPELHKFATGEQLTFQDAAIMHCIRLRGGSTTLAEMLIFLHRHDLAAVQYSLRKLEKAGLVRRAKGPQRREIYYFITDKGRDQTVDYAAMRAKLLIKLCEEVVGFERSMAVAAAALERLTGIYDQATQDALNEHLLLTTSNRHERQRSTREKKRS
jgi:predicted MarR family transcription regulator